MGHEKEFFERLASILDEPIEKINQDYVFGDVWDSLTILAISATIDNIYDIIIPVKKLGKCTTVEEVLQLIDAEGEDGEW